VSEKSKNIKKEETKNGDLSPEKINEPRGKEAELIMKEHHNPGFTPKDQWDYFQLDEKYKK
jgi:hypothetical protein